MIDVFTGSDVSTPVVVLGVEYGGLAAARSLGRAGVPMHAVHSGRAPGMRSRYWTGTSIWDLASRPGTETVGFLVDLAKAIGRRAILVPTTDRETALVAGAAADLSACFDFASVEPDRLRSLMNKEEMYTLAAALGVPTALVSVPRSSDEVAAFTEHAAFPIVVKGIEPARKQGKLKVIAHRPEEIHAIYRDAGGIDPPNLMLQEYIPGDDATGWTFYGYFDRASNCLASFSASKIRLWPAYTGSISLGVTDDNQAAQEVCRRFMKAVSYRGPVNIGGKFDRRDGQYKVLDVNPRLGASFRLCVSEEGLDLARILYLDLTHQPVPAVRPRVERKWLLEEDFFAFRQYVRDGRLSYGQWWRSLRGVEEYAWWSRDDPMPCLWWSVSRIKRLVGR